MNGHIPVLFVEGNSLAEAWEKSVLEVYRKGCNIKTEYDKSGDPPSKDCTMTVVVHDPLTEPMIHRDMPGGLEDLQEFAQRTYRYSDVQDIMEEAIPAIREKAAGMCRE